MNPEYPIYIISKGRWESRLTSKSLEILSIPYRIVIEPQEYEQYAAVIAPEKILMTPFSNLGQGSIPVRNWVWEHSIQEGYKRHWILDDNIRHFYRMNKQIRIRVADGTIFKIIEEFVDRYENIALAGMNYHMFGMTNITSKGKPPLQLNTRIYSCILINNILSHRWRGRYNEDTDLSLCVLKEGWCTVLFNAFLCGKNPTMQMKGGNTDELYQGDGRLQMARSLYQQHPDVVNITYKWGRWQHQVDYRPFKKNRLILKEGIEIPDGVNNYGMILETNFKDQA